MAATENYLKLQEWVCGFLKSSLIVFLEVNNAPSLQVDFVENIKRGTKNNIKCNSV